MPGQTLTTDVFVLRKRPATAENWFTLILFSGDHGQLTALQRLPRRAAGSVIQLDLFDEAAVVLESSNQGRTWFVREVRLLTRRSGLGRSYAALQEASALASLLVRNPSSPEGRPALAVLLRTALAALETAERPEIVYFKSLYCFARDEGYPVKQDWFASLNAADRAVAADLLNRPLSEQSAPAAAVDRLRRLLEDYMRAHTEIAFDGDSPSLPR